MSKNNKNGGRPLHKYWEEANFQAIRSEGKIRALCLLCNKHLQNTAQSRLKLHRNVCPVNKSLSFSEIHKIEGVVNDQNEVTTTKRLKMEPRMEDEESENNDENQDGVVIVETIYENYENKEEESAAENIITIEEQDQDNFIEVYNEDYLEEDEDLMEHEILEDTITKGITQHISITKLDPSTAFIDKEQPSSTNFPMKEEIFTRKSSQSTIKVDQEEIDEKLAEFFFACNIPFSVAESIYFKNFIKSLNNFYTIPKTKFLLSDLLEKTCEKHNLTINSKKSSSNTEANSLLLLSGFNKSRGVVACLQTQDDTRHFLNFWDFDGDPCNDEDGEDEAATEKVTERLGRVSEILEDCKEYARTKYSTKLYAAVFDGLEVSTPLGALWCITCNCYEANQLAQEITDPQLVGNVVAILKIFENPELEREIIRNGGCRLVFPWTEKWCTYRETMHCFLKNYNVIFNVISSNRLIIADKILEPLTDEKFLTDVKIYLEALDAICKLIYTCQKKKTTLAEACEIWLTLELPSKYRDILENVKKITLTPPALAANFLDPRYKGRRLSEEQLDAVEDFFIEYLNANGLDDLFTFKANNGIFKILTDKNLITPTTFWGIAERKHPDLSKMAKFLLKIPASVSQVEKLFTNFTKIQMPVRNILGLEKLRKLLRTYFNLRLKTINAE